MNEDIKTRFKALGSFPSPPGIAQQIIALARNPDTGIGELAGAISKDPALATKVLRIANSAIYGQRRKSQNVRQALTVMGVDSAMTLCLGFSIAGSFRSSKPGKIDYTRYWRHSLLGGLAARCIGEEIRLPSAEDLFLAALLQDIGVVALDRAKPGFYAELPSGADHLKCMAYERERLSEDHAALGAWLLGTWNLPDELCRAVELSHAPELAEETSPAGRFVRCVALGGELAAALLAADRHEAIRSFSDRASRIVGLQSEQIGRIVERVTEQTPELAQLFDTKLLSPEDAMELADEARELLATRNTESLQAIDTLRQASRVSTARAEALEDVSRRDSLTGLYNRGYLDQRLTAEFSAAQAGRWELAVLFIDLDHFKRINDTLGHQAGDVVLRGAAALLKEAVRDSDVVARYGGEEFVILLPGTSRPGARVLGERLLAKLRAHRHVYNGTEVAVTASLGLAVHELAKPFRDVATLVAAADAAVYAAKHAGRDRLAEATSKPAAPAASVG